MDPIDEQNIDSTLDENKPTPTKKLENKPTPIKKNLKRKNNVDTPLKKDSPQIVETKNILTKDVLTKNVLIAGTILGLVGLFYHTTEVEPEVEPKKISIHQKDDLFDM